MPEKDGSKIQNAAAVDFHALEIEIDNEIDSLFVPAELKSIERSVDIEVSGTSELTLEPAPSKPVPHAAEGIDFYNFEAATEIDKQIDSLFVPASQKMATSTSLRHHDTSELMLEPAVSEANGNSGQSPELYDLDAANEIDQQIDSLFVPAAQKPVAVADAPAAPEMPKLELEPAASEADRNPGQSPDLYDSGCRKRNRSTD